MILRPDTEVDAEADADESAPQAAAPSADSSVEGQSQAKPRDDVASESEGEPSPTLDEGSLLFHAALLAGVVPGAGVPIAAVAFFRTEPGSRWRPRSAALGALDLVLVVLVLVASALAPMDLLGDLTSPVAPSGRRARLGAEIDRTETGQGARVLSVIPGSPADVVGLRAGDHVVAMDDAPIDDGAALRAALDAGVLGTSRHVTLRGADGSARSVWITPTLDSLAASPSSAEACAAPSAPSSDALREGLLEGLPLTIAAAIVVFALWGFGWRRGVSGLRFWPGFVATLLLAPPLGALAASPLCAFAVSQGVRPQTVELVVAELMLTLFALLFLYTQRSQAAAYVDDIPRWGYLRTVGTGAVYLVLWLPRAMMLMLPIVIFSSLAGQGIQTAPIAEVLEGARAGPIDAVLTFLAAAILAPIAEEALFRGTLNPYLSRFLGAWPALVLGAIMFGAMHLGGHGMLLVGPLVIGAVLGWARLRSGNLAASMTLHAMLNGFATSLALFM